ncbi:hypothetical protein [Pseudorhodoplanes sp.]|uniref:hypothetical protein n=1 Tax=Pseudorhodoplanes sp. TaxID=1934341 RepID=UPI002BD4108C|nr:hypothetical protein [Pseudorhodoplanes sp.]HWV43684.1 hypothetical protein [Pseudorhodoplanes sp.]
MTRNRPPLRQPTRVQRAPRRIPDRTPATPVRASTQPKSWHSERRRGVVAAVVVTCFLGVLLSGYGIHTQMTNAAARAAAREAQAAMLMAAALRTGTLLFVPQNGNVCRRRWIDNETWTLSDGGDVVCEEEVTWNANLPVRERKVERRLDAIRQLFQSKTLSVE